MNEQRRAPVHESLGDALRFVAGWLLALLMLLPALIIKVADTITMWRVRRREERDREK
jgi:hypothetical protein